MGKALIENDGFTMTDVMDNYDTILEEVETWFEEAEEVGSSDWFYLRMSILQTLGKPSIYSKEKNKYNERFQK
jgi:hypothetical protein